MILLKSILPHSNTKKQALHQYPLKAKSFRAETVQNLFLVTEYHREIMLSMPHLEEEFKDHEGYMHIPKTAEEEGCGEEAGVLRDIAHEEKTHHKLLEELMHTGK